MEYTREGLDELLRSTAQSRGSETSLELLKQTKEYFDSFTEQMKRELHEDIANLCKVKAEFREAEGYSHIANDLRNKAAFYEERAESF